MRDDLSKLRGKAFDLLLQEACPRTRNTGVGNCLNCDTPIAPRARAKPPAILVRGGRGLCEPCYSLYRRGNISGAASVKLGETLNPQDLLGVDTDTVLSWRRGQKIPKESTLQRIMPKLTALGIPEEIWLEAREISVQAHQGYWTHVFRRKRCKRGHDLTPENATVVPVNDKRAVRQKYHLRCDLCVKIRREEEVQKVSKERCSSCGRFPPAPYRNDKLCGSCAGRKLKFGDPAPRGVPSGQGISGFVGVHERKIPEGFNRAKRWTTRPYVGIFADPKEAALARDAKIRELGLENKHRLNFPEADLTGPQEGVG
jgi:hypothetical protein